jgi:molecular chaperone DnaK
MTLTCGIDFGTSKSVIAINDGNNTHVITGPDKSRSTPSIVFFDDKTGKRSIGRAAATEGRDRPEFCFRHVKRLFGEKFVDGEDNGWQVTKGPDGNKWLRGPDRDYSPVEIASFIIKDLLDSAESRLRGPRPDGAVITHPAHYNDEQKACVLEAGRLAGLDRVYLLTEPAAAVIPYGLEQDKIRALSVFDMGAGTADFAVLHGGKTGGKSYFEAKKWDALSKGGIDADYAIVDWLLDAWYDKYGTDLGQDGEAVERLREAAERAKIDLSTNSEAHISLPLLEYTPPRSLDEVLTLQTFEDMLKPLTDEAIACCEGVLAKAGMTKANISEWILVGGMTNVPAIRKAIREFAGKEPLATHDPDEVVAIGAAIHAAAMIDGRIKPYTLVKRVGVDFGFEASGDVFHKVIKHDDAYPLEVSVPIGGEEDDQPELSIHVIEGDGMTASGAKRIAAADLKVIDPMPRGLKIVSLTFKVDENGMKSVSHAGGTIYG